MGPWFYQGFRIEGGNGLEWQILSALLLCIIA